MIFYHARIAPLSYKYVISEDGEPTYVADVEPAELVFSDSNGEEVFRVEDRFFASVEGYHVVDSETDSSIGRLVDEIAFLGRRWTIRDADDRAVATIRDKGKLNTLIYELGLGTTLPLPLAMEIVLSSGRRVGLVRRAIGVHNEISIDLDGDVGFDPRLALGAALMLDQNDVRDRDRKRRLTVD